MRLKRSFLYVLTLVGLFCRGELLPGCLYGCILLCERAEQMLKRMWRGCFRAMHSGTAASSILTYCDFAESQSKTWLATRLSRALQISEPCQTTTRARPRLLE